MLPLIAVLALWLAPTAPVRAADAELDELDLGPKALDLGLEVNVCNDLSQEKFLCREVFGEFCTYCRKDSGNLCVTKKGVKRAESGAPACLRSERQALPLHRRKLHR